jgi:hypothetical protein
LRCLCVLCSYHLEKKESRLPSMSPFVFILYTIWSISSSPGEQNTKNNLHLISNSCSYTGLFPSSYSLCDCWLENFQRENMEGRKEE